MEYKDTDPVRLNEQGDGIIIIDQTQLPNEVIFKTVRKVQEMYDAILKLEVRGAPCIGVFAGYCMALLSYNAEVLPYDAYAEKMHDYAVKLNSSRPTAVNLSWALKRQEKLIKNCADMSPVDITGKLFEEAEKIHAEDIEMCMAISEYGLSLLHDGDGLLTHCNAGPLATTRYGTGLGPIILGTERGYKFHVYSDETRPLLQGARLTAYEMVQAGVDETVICDNMASLVMKQGKIQAVLVGCDRVAANCDAANKIGTSGVAILAKYYGIPFYVLGPRSTIDMNCASGDDIRIEMRDPDEIRTMWYRKPMMPERAKGFNPSFDVTDHSLITAIVTDKGILKPPFGRAISEVMRK